MIKIPRKKFILLSMLTILCFCGILVYFTIFPTSTEIRRYDSKRKIVKKTAENTREEIVHKVQTQKIQKSLLPPKIFYNRVGKCGSRSLMYVAQELSKKNNFSYVSSGIHAYTRPNIRDLLKEIQLFRDLPHSVFYVRHIHFIDFRKFGVDPPVYINMIRDPIERFLSHYYYAIYGDNNDKMKDVEAVDINDCILHDLPACKDKWPFYIGDYFCGQGFTCKNTSMPEKVYLAKKHLEYDYLVVGMLEEFENTLEILQVLLPEYFSGAVDVWKSISKVSLHKTATKKKTELVPEARKKLRLRLKEEYEVYEHAVMIFERLKQEIGIKG